MSSEEVGREPPGGRSTSSGGEQGPERRLLEAKVHAALLRRDLEACGMSYLTLFYARLRFYRREDDSALAEITRRLEAHRRRRLN
ncbi:MAG: hypothetical protein ACYC33_10585 [Thermoleophilia bacterium]